MAIRNFKPTTAARRKMSTLVNEDITKSTPEKSLVVSMNKKMFGLPLWFSGKESTCQCWRHGFDL